MIRNCTGCNEQLKPDAKFCGKCGTKVVIQVKCVSCNALLGDGDAFCTECGTPQGKVPEVKPAEMPRGITPEAKPAETPREQFKIRSKLDGHVGLDKYLGQDPDVFVPKGVSRIEQGAFKDNPSVVSITLPESVRIIESAAFCECPNLTNLALPDKLTDLLYGFAFNCPNLTNITFKGQTYSPNDNSLSKLYDLIYEPIPDGVG